MAEEKQQVQVAEKQVSRIPTTSVAVMIFILLVAFACVGVQVVVGMVESNNAPVEIKGKNSSQRVDYPVLAKLPQGVAAEVNGVEISENDVTEFILNMRANLGLEDQDAWDEWMIQGSNSTETLRNRVILYYINNEVIDQLAEKMGINPTQEDIDAMREEIFADPEQVATLEASLLSEGRTLDDLDDTLDYRVKRRLISQAAAVEVLNSPEFTDAVLTVIKDRHPEYAEVESLDEVDPEIVESVNEEMVELNTSNAFTNLVNSFIGDSDIFYAKMGNNLPYKSNADTYFMIEDFKYMLNKNGIFLGEGGVFDSLMPDSEASSN